MPDHCLAVPQTGPTRVSALCCRRAVTAVTAGAPLQEDSGLYSGARFGFLRLRGEWKLFRRFALKLMLRSVWLGSHRHMAAGR